MKRKLLILVISLSLIGILSLPADATFTTGKGQRTFKIESFRVTPKIQLRGFLIGFGIDNQSSFNIKITQASEDEEETKPKMNFIIPSYEDIDESYTKFSLRGPVVDLTYQYIPKNRFFVTPNSLNALEVGLKRYTGEVYDTRNDSNTVIQNVDKTYLILGLLSRSRWENYNLFSDFKFSYDLQEVGGWLFDSQVGLEYKFKENIRLQLSYKAIASTADSEQGINLGVRIHY
ncbi:hypothetical protein [Halanaerobacter jeridensis]|uniref:Outer membrane protein beta-barrel domain-containing protein n=1 Tax=Halanaerobacter jeridensis TaxID=706427 RepID=A0A938XR89_9FIRM|nr:hypothetical protein [Halanaerobacter jeridensis]MBM7555955.1 hypothetical protein [Halanaerobacter jeridensis]